MRIVVIPDIHGELKQLKDALVYVRAIYGDDFRLVFLGDLIDRGPDSAGVMKLVADLVDQGHFAIMGNHEEVFLAFVAGQSQDWLREVFGPGPTLKSFEADWGKPIQTHSDVVEYLTDTNLIRLFENLSPYLLIDGLALTHAPVPEEKWDNDIPDASTSRWHSPRWAGSVYQRYHDGIGAPPGYFAVCGHIPTPDNGGERKPYLIEDKGLYLDCGCGTIEGSRLHCAVFEDGVLVSFISPDGVEPNLPGG